MYSEGKVNQPKNYPRDSHGRASLPRFKWGASVLTFFGETAYLGLFLHLHKFMVRVLRAHGLTLDLGVEAFCSAQDMSVLRHIIIDATVKPLHGKYSQTLDYWLTCFTVGGL